MAVEKHIKLTVEGDKEVKSTLADIKRALDNVDKSAGDSAGRIASIDKGLNGLTGTFAKLGAGSLVLREAIALLDKPRQIVFGIGEVGDSMRQLEAQTTAAGLSLGELDESAGRIGMRRDDFARLASTLSPLVADLGGARDDARGLAEAVGLMGKVSHTSGQAMGSALSQLQQGLAKGKLEFEDLKIMLEQAPGMSQEFARALGVSVSQMISLAREGELTSARILTLGDNLDDLRERAAKLPGTIKEAQTNLDGAWDGFLSKADAALGISEKVARALNSAAAKVGDIGAPSSQTVLNQGSTATTQDIRRAMRDHADALTQARQELESALDTTDKRFYQGIVDGNVAALERLQTQLDGVTQAQNAATAAEREANKVSAEANKAREAAKKLAEEAAKVEKTRAASAESLIKQLERQAQGWGDLTEAQRLAHQITNEGLKLTETEATQAFRAAQAIDARTEALIREKDARRDLEDALRTQATRDSEFSKFIDAGKTQKEKIEGEKTKIMDQGRAYAALGEWDAVSSAGKQLDALDDQLSKLIGKEGADGLKGISSSLGILDRVLSDGKLSASDFVTVLDGIFKDPDLLKSMTDFGQKLLDLFAGDGVDFGGALKGIGGFFGMSANGNAFDRGLVTSPGLFKSGNGWGSIGEKGPEAILPLARGSDGQLGIKTDGKAASPNVVVNVTNNVGAEVRTEAREGPNGPELSVMIDRHIKDGLARGKYDREMRGSFGLARRGK
ncbi:MAG: tape measure protein [Burkholderiaceae bacterium]